MIDLNSGSGYVYGRDPSWRPGIADAVNAAIDAALIARNAEQPARRYVSTSGIGRECLRQIQYDYAATPKDPGREFSGSTLRIFEAGHRDEDVVAAWLRMAGFDLRTARSDGRQFGFSVLDGRVKGHIDGAIVAVPAIARDLAVPCLWENKALGAKSWADTKRRGVTIAKPVYAAQIALYQAYMDLAENPALFTAINRDTREIYCETVPFDGVLAQRMSDRAVDVVRATEAQELLPRVAASRDFFLCRFCDWQDRCWGSKP